MQVILTKLKEKDPVLAASVSKIELMVRPCPYLLCGMHCHLTYGKLHHAFCDNTRPS